VEYAPILKEAGAYYGVTESAVVWCSNIYYIVYAVFAAFLVYPI
jgi:hypothetical protein